MTYKDFKYLTRRTAPDETLNYKAFNIAKNSKYDGYQRWLPLMVYKCFDKNTSSSNIKNEKYDKKELHKSIIRKIEKREVKSRFIDNIWSADLADMQLINKFNKGIRFLLNVIDIFSKYAWIILLKDQRKTTITNAFQKIIDESNRKPTKIWVEKTANFIIDEWNHE